MLYGGAQSRGKSCWALPWSLPCREGEYLHPASAQGWGRSGRSRANGSPKPMKPRVQNSPILVWSPCSAARLPSPARLYWPCCLPVSLPPGCHKGGAEVNGAKRRINLHVLICSCSQVLVVEWPFSKHRALARGGMHGGEERKVRVSKHSPPSAGVLLSFFAGMRRASPSLRLVLSILTQGRQRNP